MALTPSTKQCIALNTIGPAGIIYTGLQVGTGFQVKTITNKSISGSRLNYTCYLTVKAYSIDANGLEISTSTQLKGTGNSSASAEYSATIAYNQWNPTLANNTSYWISGSYGGYTFNTSRTSTTYDVQYYALTFTASSVDVNNVQVGNVALYVNDVLVAGSISTTRDTNAASVSYTYNTNDTSQASLPNVKVVVTACVSTIKNWHQSYFYNGIAMDDSEVADGNVIFEANAATTVNAKPTSNATSFVVNYGAKYALTINKGTGVAGSTVSYARSHSTGDYVSDAVSPVSLSGSGTLYVEHGANVSASASCASGYVFSMGNGFISQTGGVNSIYGSNLAEISGTIVALTKAASFNITASTYTISASIADHPEWGKVYIDTVGTTSKTLVQGTTYTFHFASSRADYEAPTVASWYMNGTSIDGNTYTADALTGNVAITCMLTQNAWPVTVSAGSNGSATISGRYSKQSGAQLANTGYLRADGTDYIKLSIMPNAHYGISQVSKSDNLEEYEEGGEYAYSMTSGANATVSLYFALVECVIRTLTNDPTLCDVSPSSAALRFDAETSVNVYCQIKETYVGQYRVDYFTAGGAQYAAEAGGTGQYYYTVYAAVLGGKSELTFVPHLVSTSNALTVTKSGDTSFATVFVQVDGGTEESISGSSWSAQVREARPVIVRAVAAFGGSIGAITSSGIDDSSITESQISFAMPSNAASVDFAIAEKDRVTLALCVANATDPTVAVGKVTLTSVASTSVHEEVATLAAQSFNIYKGTTYTLTADDADETYTFSGWYLNDSTFVSSNLSISINCNDLSSKFTAKYVMRTSGTITVSYGIKSGDDVIAASLPFGSLAFGLAIDTEPNLTNPDKWVVGNSHYIDFHVLDDGTSVEEGITYIWTPVRVEVMTDSGSDTRSTVWTYDAKNPESRSGRFVMRDNMLVRLVFVKVQAAGYARVQALFVDGNTGAMGKLSIFATGMLTYNSIGGVAEAACYVGRKVVLAAAPKPGYAFGGWFKKVDGAFVSVDSNGAVLTISAVTASGGEWYADFSRSGSSVKSWNDGAAAKAFEWRSKVFVGAQFLVLRNVRIYSDKYPVTLTLMTATSPNGCFGDGAHTLTLSITNQRPRQIPAMRIEKYFAFKVQGTARINHVSIASSMEGLK